MYCLNIKNDIIKKNTFSAFILCYLAQISSSSLCLGCCAHSTVSSAWNRVLVDAHHLSSTSISITNERPFTHGATAYCSFILMNQDTNTLSLKMRQKPTQRSVINHLFLPPASAHLHEHFFYHVKTHSFWGRRLGLEDIHLLKTVIFWHCEKQHIVISFIFCAISSISYHWFWDACPSRQYSWENRKDRNLRGKKIHDTASTCRLSDI